MITSRGWWFLVVLGLMGVLGSLFSYRFGHGLIIVALTLLSWFLYEWANFVYRVYFVFPRMRFHRELSDDRKVVPVLWVSSEFEVRVKVELGGADLPFVRLEDIVPPEAVLLAGEDHVDANLTPTIPAEIIYRIRCETPGELFFEGVRIRFADRQGFFYKRQMHRERISYAVLPKLTGVEGKRRGSKKMNIFPPPGLHRLRRPGGGSELLDLRDYMAGDPPKMIAWKPSARRDKLITKEFESEVPLRCTLFVDTSESTRLGSPKKTKLTRLVNLTAGTAEAIVADRDHVGLVVFDEQQTHVMRPKRSRRHVVDMLHLLAESAARSNPISPMGDADALARIAYPLAHEVHPELMQKQINTLPLRMFWSPASDRMRWGWLKWIIPLAIFWMMLTIFMVSNPLAVVQGQYYLITNLFYVPIQVLIATFDIFFRSSDVRTMFFLEGALIFSVLAFFLINGVSGFFGQTRKSRGMRKQLGLLFATIDSDTPGAESHYLHNDSMFARRAQRFMAEHHTRYPIRLYDGRGRYMFRNRRKLDVLCDALNHAVARGRDNELFVILADLIELADNMEELLRTVQVAIARHHQVVVIIPWQEDIPDPPAQAPATDEIPTEPAERFAAGSYRALSDQISRDLVDRYHRFYFRLRKEFGKLGVLVVRADQGEPVQLILDRLDRMRGVGRGR